MQEELFLDENTSPSSPEGAEPASAAELKGSVFTLPVLRLRSADLDAIEQALEQRLGQSLRFFENAPVVIDPEPLEGAVPDFEALCRLLRKVKLVPVGLRQGSEAQQRAALAAGLALVKGGALQESAPRQRPSKREEEQSPVRRVVVPGPARVVEQPVRSGQQVYARGGDLIVLAPVNAGAEIIADGNIHVYAPLRGRALAGVMGNTSARIIALSMEAELLSIAGNYQIFEERLPAHIAGKAAQVYLEENRLELAPLR